MCKIIKFIIKIADKFYSLFRSFGLYKIILILSFILMTLYIVFLFIDKYNEVINWTTFFEKAFFVLIGFHLSIANSINKEK